jgi:hypothetical protein
MITTMNSMSKPNRYNRRRQEAARGLGAAQEPSLSKELFVKKVEVTDYEIAT